MNAPDLFDRCVISALEGASGGKLKVKELRQKSRVTRGITDILLNLRTRGIVSWRDGELTMETEVSLAYG